MNNGKPIIVNGKIKRYKCVEEYVLLDEHGKSIPSSAEMTNENGQSNKEFFVEPTKNKSNILPPTSSEFHEQKRDSKATSSEKLIATTTTMLESHGTKMPETPLHSNDLNVKKLIHTPSFETTPNLNLNSRHSLQPMKVRDELAQLPDSAKSSELRRAYRHKSRFPQLRYRYFLPRDYDDYQYYENDREYEPKVNYRRPYPEYRNLHRQALQQDYESSREFSNSREPLFHPSSSEYYRNLLIRQKERAENPLPRSNEIEYRVPSRMKKYSTNERPNIAVKKLSSLERSRELYKRPSLPPLPTEIKSFVLEDTALASKLPTQPLPVANHSAILFNPLSRPPILPIATTSKPSQMSAENCKKLTDLANSFGVSDPQQWVRKNCSFAKTFVPNVTCEQLTTFVDSCFRHHLF